VAHNASSAVAHRSPPTPRRRGTARARAYYAGCRDEERAGRSFDVSSRNIHDLSSDSMVLEPGEDGLVIELNTFHSEVLPTSLAVLASLGVNRAAVYARTRRDLPELMSEWGVSPRWLSGRQELCQAIHFAKVVLFQSPEYMAASGAPLAHYLPMSNDTVVILGCHNHGACASLRALAESRPRTVVLHWYQRSPSILPYYMGPIRWPLSTSRDVLVPGALSPHRRDYSLLRHVPLQHRVHLFGTGQLNDTNISRYHPSISQQQGDFATLISLARRSTYILSAPTGSYAASYKMTSSVALAIAYGLPLIARAEMLAALRLPGIGYKSSANNSAMIHQAVGSAFSMSDEALARNRRALWAWRQAHFEHGMKHLRRLIFTG